VPRIGLVLGAGAATGHAFHAGVLSAIETETGWDPRDAEIIVGTSAGSSVASTLRAGVRGPDLFAQVTGEPLSEEGRALMMRLRPGASPTAATSGRRLRLPNPISPRLLARAAVGRARPAALFAAALPHGRLPTAWFVEGFRTFYEDEWPERALWIVAVRLRDGRRVVLGRPGAPSTDVATAVRASCAIPSYYEPVVIDGTRYVDGGVHSPTNADLLAGLGLDLVIVSSPMSRARRHVRPSMDVAVRTALHQLLQREIAKVRRNGTKVITFEPTLADQAAMGLNALDPTRRRPVATQARASAIARIRATGLGELLSSAVFERPA
jgi:NTE family protein